MPQAEFKDKAILDFKFLIADFEDKLSKKLFSIAFGN
jgi:hypothetical protein